MKCFLVDHMDIKEKYCDCVRFSLYVKDAERNERFCLERNVCVLLLQCKHCHTVDKSFARVQRVNGSCKLSESESESQKHYLDEYGSF